MTRIDTSTWHKYRLDEIFDMRNTHSITQNSIVPESGETPYVTASNSNNGVLFYIDCPDEWKDAGGCIMIGGKTLTFSYQKDDFCSNDSHNIALYALDERGANKYCYLFMISSLRAAFSSRYQWSDSISMKRIKDEEFYLPATSDGFPDWGYIESYMREVFEDVETSLGKLKQIEEQPTHIDTGGWGEFRIGDLFDVVKGTRLTKSAMREGKIRFIGSSAMNNGITALIENNEHIHPANTLTVCYNGSIGETFYQDEPFWASDDVNVLYPKYHFNREIALFVVPLIKTVSKKYTYIDKWKLETMKADRILLPILKDGSPNWDYMETYMRDLMSKAESSFRALSKVSA